MLYTVIGILIPLLGTTLGAALVFFLPRGLSGRGQRFTFGFAGGVMIAASVWSLLIPSVELAQSMGAVGWVPALVGFAAGVIFMLAIDILVPTPEYMPGQGERGRSMLCFAVTLHNLPEGMAVGVAFAGALAGDSSMLLTSAFVLAFGIALQNIPEGAVLSLPLRSAGRSRISAFSVGFYSGIIEPIGSVLTLLLVSFISPLLPYILSFSAGCMMYVVSAELIPGACERDRLHIGTVGVMLGFALMMVLDVALS